MIIVFSSYLSSFSSCLQKMDCSADTQDIRLYPHRLTITHVA